MSTILDRIKAYKLDEVAAALRAGGCLHAHEVARATIEVNGQITVVLRPTQRPLDAT